MKAIAKMVVVALALAMSHSAAAQNLITVDYDSIESIVKNRPEVFSALTSRFMDADTTLTMSDVAVVYFGHAFTPGYNPTESFPEMMEAYESDDMNLAIALGEQDLRRNPVSLMLLMKLYGACATSQVPRLRNQAPQLQQRILMLCDMISSTGLGVMPESPWCVICESDMEELLAKYIKPQRVIDRSTRGDEEAVKVKIDGIDDDVILYFDLVLARKPRN